MKESWIKKSNCCPSRLPCEVCQSCASCKKWADYVSRHRAGKRYAHLDERTSLGDYRTRSKVSNPSWVAKHGFMPLISYEIKRSKFSRKGRNAERKVKSPRIIRYCSHMDRCIYQRYAFLLGEAHDCYAIEAGIDGSAIAYRSGKAKSTIDYAKSAFDFLVSAGECVVLVADFESFFENVDHKVLKRALCYKMRRKARTVAVQGRGARNMYGTYSKHAHRLTGRGSFVDYTKKASDAMHLNDPAADSVIRRDMEKITKAINEQRE